MKRLSISIALGALAVALASCDDPITSKERSLEALHYKEGVLTTSQTFDFSRWIEDAKNTYWASASNQGYTLLSSSPTDFPVVPLEVNGEAQGAVIRSIKGIYVFGFGTNVIAGALYTGQVDT